MSELTPRGIVSELDNYIVGQEEAKKMVAIAVRNRWRRNKLSPELRDEVAPKNILMIGPTGVGKTEIARRLAKLTGAPFFKVEATKFTEVGYVGRDVESMIRDLMEIGINMLRNEEIERVKEKAAILAEDRLLDLLLPAAPDNRGPVYASSIDGTAELTTGNSTKEKFRKLFKEGKLDDKVVPVEISAPAPQVEIFTMPGMDDLGMQFKDMMGRMFPGRKKTKNMTVPDAYATLLQEESERLVDMDKVIEAAKERVEQSGIIFIDEIDKICVQDGRHGPDVSREGVQRDLLPVVEGCVVNTKYGMISTDHILFIAAGAFHFSKPSDLVPELQGRFPLRAELTPLNKDDFLRILTEPKNALTTQYVALLATEGVTLYFQDEALEEIAAFAQKVNEETENIGARRLYTILERLLFDLSFEASERSGDIINIDRGYTREKLNDVVENRDLTRYML